MGWLKRADALGLYQESDLPYIVHEDGLYLCCANSFTDCVGSIRDEHSIHFRASTEAIMRQSSNCFKFRRFPVLIPLSDVYKVDDYVKDGTLEWKEIAPNSDAADIAFIRAGYLRRLGGDDFDEFSEGLTNFDSTFLVVGENFDERSRALGDDVNVIHHVEWARTALTVADNMCRLHYRRYNWINAVPLLNISCYGFTPEHIEKINRAFHQLGLEIGTSLEE